VIAPRYLRLLDVLFAEEAGDINDQVHDMWGSDEDEDTTDDSEYDEDVLDLDSQDED
jgi:hypothetical protein